MDISDKWLITAVILAGVLLIGGWVVGGQGRGDISKKTLLSGFAVAAPDEPYEGLGMAFLAAGVALLAISIICIVLVKSFKPRRVH